MPIWLGLLLHTMVPALAGCDQIPDLWALDLCGYLVVILNPSDDFLSVLLHCFCVLRIGPASSE